jgi:hypothetical protein
MGDANLTLRFILELVAVGVVGYWGFTSTGLGLGRIVLGIGAPLALLVLWTLVISPSAPNPLSQPQRDVIGTGLLVLAAGALGSAGHPIAALGLGVLVVVNWTGLVLLGPGALDAMQFAVE